MAGVPVASMQVMPALRRLGKQGMDGVQKQDLHAPTDMSTPIPK